MFLRCDIAFTKILADDCCTDLDARILKQQQEEEERKKQRRERKKEKKVSGLAFLIDLCRWDGLCKTSRTTPTLTLKC